MRDDADYDTIMNLSYEEDNLLATSVLQTIDLVLKMESEEMLPSYDDTKAMLLAEDNVDWPDKLTQEFGDRKQVYSPVDGIRFVGETFVDDSEVSHETETNYEVNNVTIDRPVESD